MNAYMQFYMKRFDMQTNHSRQLEKGDERSLSKVINDLLQQDVNGIICEDEALARLVLEIVREKFLDKCERLTLASLEPSDCFSVAPFEVICPNDTSEQLAHQVWNEVSISLNC